MGKYKVNVSTVMLVDASTMRKAREIAFSVLSHDIINSNSLSDVLEFKVKRVG